MKKFRSKIGLGIILFIVLNIGGTSCFLVLHDIWAGLIINLLVLTLIIYLILSTRYITIHDNLTINGCFTYNKTFNINDITKISATNDPISSPAWSLDRLKLQFKHEKPVLISPRNKQEFINHLLTINPNIEVAI